MTLNSDCSTVRACFLQMCTLIPQFEVVARPLGRNVYYGPHNRSFSINLSRAFPELEYLGHHDDCEENVSTSALVSLKSTQIPP